jgi:UDPglucose--hexose-1-phosphate uridylyltransferase
MELKKDTFAGAIIPPGEANPIITQVEVRWDPLTGHTARLVSGPSLLPNTSHDVAAVVERTRGGCPFCPEAIERTTPRFPPAVYPGGRFTVGEAVLFPNLLAYSQYSSVAVYSPRWHHLPLTGITSALMRDNLTAQVEFIRAVQDHDPAATWASINANHLPPSGSSVYHPHTQGGVHPVPTTMQRQLADVPRDTYADYLNTERHLGERYLGRTGRLEWLTSFAPIAPAEIRAFAPGLTCPARLDASTVEELASGLSRVLDLYAELGASSFNLAIYGSPADRPGPPLSLRVACRSGLAAYYRSDATYLERLHWEAATGIRPEQLAERARNRFT